MIGHTNEIAIKILKDEYHDYPYNDWHYDREYKMLVKAIELSKLACDNTTNPQTDNDTLKK